MLAVLGQVFDVSAKPSIYGAWDALPPLSVLSSGAHAL